MLCFPVLICAKYQVFGEVMSLGINKCLGLKKNYIGSHMAFKSVRNNPRIMNQYPRVCNAPLLSTQNWYWQMLSYTLTRGTVLRVGLMVV